MNSSSNRAFQQSIELVAHGALPWQQVFSFQHRIQLHSETTVYYNLRLCVYMGYTQPIFVSVQRNIPITETFGR